MYEASLTWLLYVIYVSFQNAEKIVPQTGWPRERKLLSGP